MKMSSFAEAKILIATKIFKEIDEWIVVDVEGKSYNVKVMEDLCVQPYEVEKQIPKESLDASPNSDEEEEDKDDEGDIPMPVRETNGKFSNAELNVLPESETHFDLLSDGFDSKQNEANLEGDN